MKLRLYDVTLFLLHWIIAVLSYCDDCHATEIVKHKNISGLYLGLQYYGDLLISATDLTGQENVPGVHTKSILGFDTAGNSVVYSPKYVTDYIAGGVSLGMPFKSFRLEAELQYYNIEPDKTDFTRSSQAEYFELQRDDNISGGVESGGIKSPLLENKYTYSIGSSTNTGTGIMPSSGSLNAEDHLALKFNNHGIHTMALMLNVSHDIIDSKNNPIIPFITLGAGISKNTFLKTDAYGAAYQIKIGIRYYVSDNVSFQTALDYRKSTVKTYRDVTPDFHITQVLSGAASTPALAPTDDVQRSTNANFETEYGVYGIMSGMIIEF